MLKVIDPPHASCVRHGAAAPKMKKLVKKYTFSILILFVWQILEGFFYWELFVKSQRRKCKAIRFHSIFNKAIYINKIMFFQAPIKKTLSTSSLIWPSYTIRATIFEKVFWPEKFPKTEDSLLTFFSDLLEVTALIASLLRREGKGDSNFKSSKIKRRKKYSNTSPHSSGVTFHCQGTLVKTFNLNGSCLTIFQINTVGIPIPD